MTLAFSHAPGSKTPHDAFFGRRGQFRLLDYSKRVEDGDASRGATGMVTQSGARSNRIASPLYLFVVASFLRKTGS
ncbi:MAG: hypothetical protein KKB37_04805 [Alphaproteobacteria bacterium]|nr:hypothetical protein [Alphaproteobacteria bacterium]